jgi:hypothetical protein
VWRLGGSLPSTAKDARTHKYRRLLDTTYHACVHTQEYNVQPNTVIYILAIDACANAARPQEALLLLKVRKYTYFWFVSTSHKRCTQDMIKRGITPTRDVFNTAISACVAAGEVEYAQILLE